MDEGYWPAWPEEIDREASDLCLQDARRDTWIGLPVVVMRGRTKGTLARVLGTGSGWVQIRQAPPDGSDPMLSEESIEVSKRAIDLHVVKGYDDPDKIPLAPPDEFQGVVNAKEDEGEENGEDQEMQNEFNPAMIQIGDTVRVLEGSFEGKVGKVIAANRNTITLTMKSASSVVLKRRNEVELVSNRNGSNGDADDKAGSGDESGEPTGRRSGSMDRTNQVTGGRSSRLSAKRMEMINRRVLLTGTSQSGVIVKMNASGTSYVIALDDGATEVTKRKDEVQLLDEDGDETSSQLGGRNNEEDAGSDKEDPALTRVRARQSDRVASPKTAEGRASGAAAKRKALNQVSRAAAGQVNTATSAPAGENEAGDNGQAVATTSTRGAATRRAVRRNARIAGKRQKDMSAEQYAQTRLDATRRMRQELMVGFLARQYDKMEKSMGTASRPNLQEWLEKIQGRDEDDPFWEEAYTPLVYDPPFCSACFLEMAPGDEFCWNPSCTESPVFDKNAIPLVHAELALKSRDRFSSLAQSPRKPGFIDYASIPMLNGSKTRAESTAVAAGDDSTQTNAGVAAAKVAAEDNLEDQDDRFTSMTPTVPRVSRFKAGRKRAEQSISFSPFVTYSVRAPKVWIGDSGAAKVVSQEPQVGYFGEGWKDGLVYDEPGLPSCEQVDRVDSALDFRWKHGMVV